MNGRKRYTIGVLIGGVHTYFPKEIMKGIGIAAAELDVNVCFFLGAQTEGFFQDVLLEHQKNTYDYQFNTIHDYSLISGLDGLIISYGTLDKYLKDPDANRFARKFNSIPTVFLTEMVDVPNTHSLISDNYQGMCSVVEHLINEHHCEKILFMSGPDGNTDTEERKRAYLDTMEKYCLPVTSEMIGKGDYSEFVDQEVEKLLDNNDCPQAIAFANDNMVLSGYKVCEKRGLAVGKDILFTGYDDCERAADMIPPLTTVSQDGKTMGYTAVCDIVKRLKGENVESRRIPASLVVRESCGCLPRYQKSETTVDLAEEVHNLNETIGRMKRDFENFQRKSWYIPILERDLNDYMDDETEFCFQMMEKMKDMRANSAYLFLLDSPISYDRESDWTCPDTLSLASFYRGGKSFSYHHYDRPLVTAENTMSMLMDDGERHEFMAFLLFSGEKQYGLLVCDIDQDDFSFYYIVSRQFGLLLRYLEINKIEAARRREMSHDMEMIREQNRVLDLMSGYDELTGLLNLRGFTDQTERLQKTPRVKKAYMIYADLDHLKEINDTWGHSEGDFALQSAADILKHSLGRSDDILARIGGDEFVALATSDAETFEDIFRDRVKTFSQQLNETSDKPYYIEMSIGIVGFNLTKEMDLQNVISEADRRLYEEKKKRRESVCK